VVGDKPLDIGTDSFGNIFVVWAEDLDTTQEIMFLKSTNHGQTWLHSESDFPISFDGLPYVNANNPSMAIDRNNNLYAVWHQNAPSGHVEVHFSKSLDGGSTWSGTIDDKSISYDDGYPALNPDIAIDNDNNIYVVWAEKETDDITSQKIHYGKSTDGGATFNSEAADFPISTGIRSSDNPYVVVDRLNNVYATWRATNATAAPYLYEVFFTSTTDGGASWSGLGGQIPVDFGVSDSASAFYPSIAVTSQGNLAAVWDETPEGFSTAEIFASYSFDRGATWTGNTAPELISLPDGHGAYRPEIISTPADTLHVFWNEGVASSGYYDIHYSKGDTLGIALGYLAGVLTREGGTPVPDVAVNVFDADDMLIGADVSDEDGLYSITLGTGTVRAEFSANGYRDTTVTNINIVGGDTTFLDVVLTATGGCAYVPGNINGVPPANGIDVTYGVAYFKGGNPPADICPCPPHGNLYVAADVNASCTVNGIDITYFVGFLKGGPPLRWCADCPPSR
jgi:hypothetical protein